MDLPNIEMTIKRKKQFTRLLFLKQKEKNEVHE